MRKRLLELWSLIASLAMIVLFAAFAATSVPQYIASVVVMTFCSLAVSHVLKVAADDTGFAGYSKAFGPHWYEHGFRLVALAIVIGISYPIIYC